MNTNKFIKNLSEEELNSLKENFKYKDQEYKENNQLFLLKNITNTKDTIDLTKLQINKLLQEDDINIDLLYIYTKKYNYLCEELDILNSYKTIFNIN